MAVAVGGWILHIGRSTERGFGVFETTFALQTMVMRPSRMITIPKYLVCHFVVTGPYVRVCVQQRYA